MLNSRVYMFDIYVNANNDKHLSLEFTDSTVYIQADLCCFIFNSRPLCVCVWQFSILQRNLLDFFLNPKHTSRIST